MILKPASRGALRYITSGIGHVQVHQECVQSRRNIGIGRTGSRSSENPLVMSSGSLSLFSVSVMGLSNHAWIQWWLLFVGAVSSRVSDQSPWGHCSHAANQVRLPSTTVFAWIPEVTFAQSHANGQKK